MEPTLKQRVYERLHDVLRGVDDSQKYAHLSQDDRRSILQILLETKDGLPSNWRSES